MHITIDEESRVPIYQQIANEIKRLIVGGELPPETALPTVRQVAGDLGVNFNTVATAYRELQEEGLLTVRHGSGAVVRGRQSDRRSLEELRVPLRTALAQLMLAGHPRTAVLHIVREELTKLVKGKK
ncbi:MAG: GntR family transcriptional regulator [Verrucomicrobiota bacterium]|nr:GntR family transcriptional regulator [Verrucomicrobiota bacterium]